MKSLWRILTLSAMLLAAACSQQNREADAQLSSDELYQTIDAIQMGAAGQDSFLSSLSIESLVTGNSSIIFHAREAGGRPATSVLSMNDMAVFGGWDVGTPSTVIGLEKVDVMFLDTIMEGRRTFTLMMSMSVNGGAVYFAGTSIPNSERFTENSFEVEIAGANGSVLVLRSNDLSEEYEAELADSIKLEVFVSEGDQLFYAGQISTMAGYGLR